MEKTGSRHTSCAKLSNEELITLARARNEAAFLELYNRNKDGLKAHLSKIISSWDVDDICMQSFLKAFLHIDSYDTGKSEFRTWLYTIAWNTAMDHLGKKKREQDNMPLTSINLEEKSVSHITDPDKTPEEEISNQEDYSKLLKHIEDLSDLYRDIAVERFINECEYSEIAEKYDLPVNTVKTRIKRAKEMLQKMMETSDDVI